uniref:O-acyltransferase n=1 Tax=Dendroctonus ponderosae TaxID=77166 RepID=J3JU12_DENPD|nr:unknown [Dendroctonus ponderosae]
MGKEIDQTVKSDSKTSRQRRVRELPTKKFQVRDSLLTILCENPHIKVVKHIFVAFLIGLFLNTVLQDFFDHGEFRVGFKVIKAGLGKFHWALAVWIALNIAAVLSYLCFNLWATIRSNFPPKAQNVQVWDSCWLLALLAYYVLQFRVISIVVPFLKLPIGSAAIICLEQTRFLMKIHAFVRGNAGKVLNYKPHSDQTLSLASLRDFMYFLYAPTLVYCDQYPRRDAIRWGFVGTKVVDFIGVIFYYAFLLERFLIPEHKDIGLRAFTLQELILKAVNNFAVGLMFLLLAFYVVLDTTQNLVGELLKFGDRQFYEDWWTSTNYSDYFRTWNMVVGDWLYTYIYKDMYEHVVPGNKTIAKITVFLVSAVVHEWVLTYMFGFFFPALFVAFIIVGSVLSFIRSPNLDIVNILFWYMLTLGSGLLSSAYAMEYFIRVNLPSEGTSLMDFLIPRLFTSDSIVY